MSARDDLTLQDLTSRGHSYRGFDPADVRAVMENQGIEKARAALKFIESGRFEPFLRAVSEFFFKLDTDEQETFTQRNPGVVQWMSVWNESHEHNPFDDWYDFAASILTPDRDGRTEPPVPFDRHELREGRTLKQDMRRRRRSYRNWTPGELFEVAVGERVAPGEVVSLTEVDADKLTGRQLLERVEAGRFEPMLDEGYNFFIRLDVDERQLFARRNPGLTEWLSAWGFLEDLIHGKEMQVSFPLVDRMGNPAGPCADLPAVIRDVIETWGRDPCRINMGECVLFAEAVADRVPAAEQVNNLEFAAQLREGPEHVWLRCGGRHYDSEAPEGVDDFRDLPFFERHYTREELEGAFIADEAIGMPEVAKEGVWVPQGAEEFSELLERNEEAIEELGITEGALPDRDGWEHTVHKTLDEIREPGPERIDEWRHPSGAVVFIEAFRRGGGWNYRAGPEDDLLRFERRAEAEEHAANVRENIGDER